MAGPLLASSWRHATRFTTPGGEVFLDLHDAKYRTPISLGGAGFEAERTRTVAVRVKVLNEPRSYMEDAPVSVEYHLDGTAYTDQWHDPVGIPTLADESVWTLGLPGIGVQKVTGWSYQVQVGHARFPAAEADGAWRCLRGGALVPTSRALAPEAGRIAALDPADFPILHAMLRGQTDGR